jgi:hypothetical protein
LDNWQALDWLDDAKELIQWAREQGSSHPLMLIIRHSHREDSTDVKKLLEKRLTELGHRMAIRFGKELPIDREVEIFFSSHPRCHETAQGIVKGLTAAGGNASLVSDIRVLLGPQGSGSRIGHEMLSSGGPKFVRHWIEERLSKQTIESIEEFGNVFVRDTIGRLRYASENSLQIHVTHDLVLMGARNILFGTVPTDDNWTSYLGGFGILWANGVYYAYEGGEELTLDIERLPESFTPSEKTP